MAETVTWIFKFCKIVIILNCYMSLADAQCSQDTNGFYRFGSECGFICHCRYKEQCNVSTGECPSGCDFEWVGPGCQHNNIALRQIVRHSDNLPLHKYPPYAIDRDLSTCSYTNDENATFRTVNPFWRVWMPYNFTLRRMKILTLDSKRKYFDGFKVLVEYVHRANRDNQTYQPDLSQICYTNSNTSLESVSMTVACDTAYTGNHVKIQLGRRNTQLVLCDVRIYGECAEHVCTYNCDKLCFCKDITAYDIVSGTCTNGCTGRWSGKNGACDKECAIDKWGATCDTQCGYCQNNAACGAVTGKCPTGCKDGYKDTQTCDIECDDGTYGQNCQSNCTGYCKNNVPCRKTDGQCPDGCSPGYIGEECSERCSSGFFGNDCTKRCSAFCTDGLSACSHVDGTCLHGCLSGYEGKLCNQECETGRWGVSCTTPCGMCFTGTCNNKYGICMDWTGCKVGYTFNPLCNQECEDGTYGLNCTGKCTGTCAQVCDKESGTCASCKAGWKGLNCDTECESETYGVDCSFKCGRCRTNSVCNKTTGVCHEGCSAGFTGERCIAIEETTTETAAAIAAVTTLVVAVNAGIGAAIMILIILGVLAILWYLRKTRNRSNEYKQENREHRAMAMSDISSEASGVKPTDRSRDTYDTFQVGNVDEHQYEL